MSPYEKRFYRKRVNSGDLVSFNMVVKETDLWVSADINLEDKTRGLVLDCRYQLESYIRYNPDFYTSLLPCRQDPYASPVVKEMIEATGRLGVGPMASVAGVIAQVVAIGLLRYSDQVIVENGGDIFLKVDRPATVSIFAGSSPLSGKFGLLIPRRQMPLGICSSSGTVGHSLSMGVADLVCILSPSAAVADGAATCLGNKVKNKKAIEDVADWAGQVEGILGGLIIAEDRMAIWGDIELVEV